MTNIDEKLNLLGIEIPRPAAPVAAYTPAVRTESLMFMAGELPLVDGALQVTGKVGVGGRLVSDAEAKECARICVLHALAAIRTELGSLKLITRVVKVIGFVASQPDFYARSAVVDDASEVIAEIFGELGLHARSAVGVAVLPLDTP